MVLSEAKYRQKAIYQRIKNRLANLKTLEAKLVGTGLDEQRLKDLRDAFDKLDHTLADLDYALARRIALRSHISWNLRQLRLLETAANERGRAIVYLLDQQRFASLTPDGDYSVWSGNDSKKRRDTAHLREYARPLDAWLGAFRMARSLLADTAISGTMTEVDNNRAEFNKHLAQLERGFKGLPVALQDRLSGLFNRLKSLAHGDTNLFKVRRELLRQNAQVDASFASSRFEADHVATNVRAIMNSVGSQIQKRNGALDDEITTIATFAAGAAVISFIAALLVAAYLNGNVLRRLRGLQEGLADYLAGKPMSLPMDRPDEIGDIGRAIGYFVEEIRRRETRLEALAATDMLTGVNNRRQFLQLAQRDLLKARRSGRPLSLLLLDIDRFKRINDDFGHSVGDEVLKGLAFACTNALRDVDVFGRFGGEEFAVMLPDSTLSSARDVAERLRRRLSRLGIVAGGRVLHFTVSVGVTALHPRDQVVDDLLQRADHALYDAKDSGRNAVVVREPASRAVDSGDSSAMS